MTVAKLTRQATWGDDVSRKPDGCEGLQSDGTLDPRILDEIIRRVVEVVQPDKIILFGSAARGEMTRHSDVDLLVIARVEDPLAVMGCIHRRLRGELAAVDVVVVTPADVARYGHSHALIIKPALREGRVVYEATSAVSAERPA